MNRWHGYGILIVFALAFVGCGSGKALIEDVQPIELPCQAAALDDAGHYRVFGMGSFFSKDRVRSVALQDARTAMQRKISDLCGKVAEYSLYNDSIVDVRMVLRSISTDYDASMVCSSVVETNGKYTEYVALEVSKETLRNNIVEELDRISKARNLGIDFTENKFIDYMNGIMEMK